MAQHQAPDHSGEAITILKVHPRDPGGITVFSRSQGPDGRLADRHSAYHDNISPPLNWSNVPDAKAWAIVVEDPDAPQEEPFVHWMIWNIRGEVNALPEGVGNDPTLVSPQGAIQGKNGRGGYGWFGPRPPAGHGLHRYYFQVFALNELLNALKGHTIAKGEMMATYEAPTQQ